MSDGEHPSRPETQPVNAEAVPGTLREREQWIAWRYRWETDREEWTKVPVDARAGDYASPTDPSTWTSIEDAVAYHRREATDTDGIGFVFSEEDLLMGVDLDDCRDPDTGQPTDRTKEIIDRLDSYTTISTSGTGYHIYLKGVIPPGADRQRHDGIEMYDSARFFVWTGDHVDGTPERIKERPNAVKDVHSEWVAREESNTDSTQKPTASPGGDLNDSELIQQAKAAENGEKFKRLWRGDTSGYESHSEADLALCNLLAFWCQGDRQRIDTLFRESGLYREKWDREDYRQRTIDRALSGRSEYYDPDSGDTNAAADGGTEAASGSPIEAATSVNDGENDRLDPVRVVGKAGYDPDEKAPGDIDNDEIAYAVAELIADSDEEHYAVTRDNHEMYAFDGQVWQRDGQEILKETLYYALRNRNSNRMHSEVEHALQSNPRLKIDREELGAPDEHVAVENGLLDLRERELRTLQPRDYALTQLPVEYDPHADYEGSEWAAFLDEAVRDGDEAKLQEYAGYCLWQHAQPYGKALFLIGPTDSGKGTFLDVIESILGEENVASQSLYQLMQTRWGMAELHGKVANIRNEVSAGGLSNVERFKELTGGGDRVSAERKGRDPFKFKAVQKFMFATNDVPTIENAGEPFFNRLLFAKFPHTVPEGDQDEGLDEDLLEEAPAILNWMLDGLDRLLAQGGFTDERTTEAKRETADAFGSVLDRFVHNLLEVTGDPDDAVHKAELYDLLNEYADHIGKPFDGQQQRFTKELKQQPGISDGKSRRVSDPENDTPRVFQGLRLSVEHIEEFNGTVPAHAGGDESASTNGGQQSL
jgi:P4 family phage/plasmid primase-like protien